MTQHWLMKPLTRRQVMTVGAVGGVAGIVGGGWTAGLHMQSYFKHLAVTQYDVKTPQWPVDYPTLRIAFLTDLHVGCMSVEPDKLDGIVAQVNALNADIILLGGDYLTGLHGNRWVHYIEPNVIAEKMALLKAPLGVYSVLGNHDWACDGEAMRAALELHGIKVLENQSVAIENNGKGFWIVGLADYLMREPSYKQATMDIADAAPRIVLSHDPFTYFHTPKEMVVQLSGHTHGGQVTLLFIGPVVSPTPGMPLDMLYGKVGEAQAPLIVSSGVGTSILPIKNTPCEVVTLEITHSPA